MGNNSFTQKILKTAKNNNKYAEYKDYVTQLEQTLFVFLPALYNGEREKVITKKNMHIIMDDIKEHGDFGAINYKRNLFESIVKAAKEQYGWKSVPIYHFILRKRESARFSSYRFLNRSKFKKIEDVLWRTIVNIKFLTPDERGIQIALTAIIYGGLIDKSLVVSFVNKSIKDISGFNEYLWIDLPANEKKAVPKTIQRWFPDPISAQLLRKYSIDAVKRKSTCSLEKFLISEVECDEAILWLSILDFLKKYNDDDIDLPESLSMLLNWAYSDYNATLPPYLVDVAYGRTSSYSMTENAWLRAVTGKQTLTDTDLLQSCVIDDVDFNDNDVENNVRVKVSSQELFNFNKIKIAILSDDIDNIKQCIDDLYSSLSPMTKHICDYYKLLLEGKAPGRHKQKGASIQKYFRYSEDLIAFARGRDIKSMSSDSIESLYEDVFGKQLTINHQSNSGYFIKGLHTYLINKYNHGNDCHIPNIYFDELDGYVSKRHSVNANVLTPSHYNRVLVELCPAHSFDNRLDCIRYFMTVLGYRLNMRRQEIRRLRLCDVRILKTQLFIRVVNTEDGKVKSLSGWRWIPAHDLFDSNELLQLREWHKYRLNEVDKTRELLFTSTKDDHSMISSYITFNVILNVLRKVTGDENIRFHSLRHSFATWLLISIEANRIPKILDRRFNIFSKSNGLEQADYQTMLDSRKPTKKLLYQLALLMGHSSPNMTLLHYVHSCDWILHHWCCKRVPRLTVEQLSPLVGVNTREVNKIVKSHNLIDLNKTVDLVQCLESYAGWKIKPEWDVL